MAAVYPKIISAAHALLLYTADWALDRALKIAFCKLNWALVRDWGVFHTDLT